jgi:hypothetical protein
MVPRPKVFIQSNARQHLGAVVSAYSLKRNSACADRFDVEILSQEDYPFFQEHEGRKFLRGGAQRIWRNEDLQSFTPLRFMPPEKMGYAGRALVIDPDIFAVRDVWPLLDRDMQGRVIMAVPRPGHNGSADYIASSVMLLDCASLTHWHCEGNFREMFAFTRDYVKWIELRLEQRGSIGLLEPEWNHFDTLNEATRLLHNTKRRTQPWKTGLPVDFTVRDKLWGLVPAGWLSRAPGRATYQPHPDPNQERFFFGLLRECLDQGLVSEAQLREEMRRNHIRHDTLRLLEHARPLAA